MTCNILYTDDDEFEITVFDDGEIWLENNSYDQWENGTQIRISGELWKQIVTIVETQKDKFTRWLENDWGEMELQSTVYEKDTEINMKGE